MPFAWPLGFDKTRIDIAPSNLRTTALDQARFALELERAWVSPTHFAHGMFGPEILVDKYISWGAGIALEYHRDPMAGGLITWWQWGANLGQKNLMVLAPLSNRAIIVMTNGESGFEVARELARLYLGVNGTWTL